MKDYADFEEIDREKWQFVVETCCFTIMLH